MKKIIRRIVISVVVLVLLLVLTLSVFASTSYTALDEMYDALSIIENEEVTFYEDRDELRYTVTNPKKNIIIVPGGLVTPDSYGYLAYSLALEGFNVTIAKAPFNLAILNQWIGKEFLSDELDNVVIGHSLGGVTASMVFSGSNQVSVMMFLGSYPIKDVSDKDTLFLAAEHDLGMDPEAFNDSMKYVNDNNTVINIDGGNHAQFGWYGPQKGDGEAEMETITQQNLVVGYIIDYLTE